MPQVYKQGQVDFETLRGSVASFVGYTNYCSARKTREEIMDELSEHLAA